jgi:toxin-antitoxin system PIN domain toxin
MTFLLDVNVLVALIDPAHVHHDRVHVWFEAEGGGEWSSCPPTENGVCRIVGHQSYPNSPGGPGVVARLMARVRDHPGHRFWADDLSLLDDELFDLNRLLSCSQVTDAYLLGLAIRHGGQLATLDRRLVVDPVRAGASGLRLIG